MLTTQPAPTVRSGPGVLVRSWLRRLLARRVRRRGLDLSRMTLLPEGARLPLLRDGIDPVPQLARVRAAGPLHTLPLPFDLDLRLAAGHDEVRAVLADRESFSTDIRHLFGDAGPGSAADVGGLGFTDPPVHTRLRRLVAPEFTRHRLQRLVPVVERIVDRRLAELAAAGSPADLAAHVSARVPMDAICGLLGLDADRETSTRLADRRFDATQGTAGAFGVVSAQRRVLRDAVARQRSDPGPGLIGRILREEGAAISDDELAGVVDGLVTGGHETTASMISLGTVVLLGHPAAAALVREGTAEDVARVVEELLRLLSPVHVAFPRFARRDMTLFGQEVRAGDAVVASLSGANRDPAWAGPDPDGFDPRREPSGGHLAFGAGAHRCVGAELARLELRIVLPALLRRFPDLALAVPVGELRFRRLSFVHGVEELPVTF